MTRKNLIPLLVALPCACALINNKIFESASLAACFYYIITASILAAVTGMLYLQNKGKVRLSNPLPLFLLVALTLYYILQEFFIVRQGLNIMHFLLLADCLLLVSYCILLGMYEVNLVTLYKIIMVLACIESIVCLFQFFQWADAPNPLFGVSGTWVNPNVTAMFLALSLAAVLALLFREKGRVSKGYFIPLALVLVALVLLKCRTAFIGAALLSAIVINARFDLLRKTRNKYKGIKFLLPVLVALLLIVPLSIYLYNVKKASAEGRQLVWKISAAMVEKKPVAGYGYGRFEHDYNLAQAGYFIQGNATGTEISNASYVSMAYNEFLQNAVEGGIMGLAIFLLLFISLLAVPWGKLTVDIPVMAAYAGVAAFIAMSVFNFTIQAIPAMGLFIIYAAIACVNIKGVGFLNRIKRPAFARVPIGLLLLLPGIYIGYSEYQVAKASAAFRQTVILSRNLTANQSVAEFEAVRSSLSQSDIYWASYGAVLLLQKNYESALEKLNTAASIKSYPNLYVRIGACYQKLGKTDSAIASFVLAENMVPNRIEPRFALMNIYAKKGDTANAASVANGIIRMNPKVVSKQTVFYKMEARRMLAKMEAQ